MSVLVLDASAWLRLFLDDGPWPEGLADAARTVEARQDVFAAPDAILPEVAAALNRIERRGALSVTECDAIWRDMRRTPVEMIAVETLIEAARTLARRESLTVFDGLYLAAAIRMAAPLLTADARLDRVARRLLPSNPRPQ